MSLLSPRGELWIFDGVRESGSGLPGLALVHMRLDLFSTHCPFVSIRWKKSTIHIHRVPWTLSSSFFRLYQKSCIITNPCEAKSPPASLPQSIPYHYRSLQLIGSCFLAISSTQVFDRLVCRLLQVPASGWPLRASNRLRVASNLRNHG